MPELRWILVFFGLVLLIGIYVWGRRSTKPEQTHADVMFRPDAEMDEGDDVEPTPAVTDEPAIDDAQIPEPEPDAIEEAPIAPPPRPFIAPRAARVDESREPTLEIKRTREPRSVRIEPSFGDEMQTAELHAADSELHAADSMANELEGDVASAAPAVASAAPTIGMSNTPPPRRIERRKIIALRLAAGAQRYPGAQLQAAFESEALEHGKYDVFHRLDEQGAAIFSVASMVEPGTFDPSRMQAEQYPGITLFAQLPGPAAGMLAFNELVACSRRLHASLGGTLQDERGVPLTVHRIERIRQEIRDFELRGAAEASQRPSPTYSA